ncbi:hypothetical protein B0J11DRAFT_439062, partial [Dendryphion nanum]
LHILMISRKEQDIANLMEDIVVLQDTINLQTEDLKDDIRQNIRYRLSNVKKLSRWHKDIVIKDEIKSMLAHLRHRFRWVFLQFDALGQCHNNLAIQKTLSNLPKTLDEIYDDVDSVYTMRILRWLAFSKRALRIEEVYELVAINPDREPMFDPNETIRSHSDILDICSCFVTITSSPGDHWNDHQPVVEIQLSHFTMNEYLLSAKFSKVI